ncbi:MAG: PilZ domain-containing protein [Desulfuromonadales bacterium]|nr:PilZ domain-containing protein [Desulfuromonadales bacterium]
MSDKRSPTRHKKRFSVHFGVEEANRVAFTEDVSLTGMFLRSLNVCPPNTKIRIEFLLENENSVVLEARVMWAKKVPQNLFHLVKKSGMGVRILRFHSGEEHFRRFCNEITLGC